jgi:xylulose-5-phosphate/fructose-6-phosphate phosphoketolase
MSNARVLDRYFRAANYLSVAQIFLQDNFLLERPLTSNDIKPRLLGHWGSCPGVNFAYEHVSALARERDQEMLFVLGPGHAFPALQANLFLEGTLEKYYPEAKHTYEGIGYICRNFSWPYGFPSHSSPSAPGAILEGGELGYSLSTAYGAALDNPDLLVACMVGDGEAESGPLAAAWHLNKLVNPKTNGVVLPILHLNGYKISGPTVFGRMSDYELKALFAGYGYHPRIVDTEESDDPHADMTAALMWAHGLIAEIRASTSATVQRLPMLILRTPKGWTGVEELDGNKVAGNHLSHQVVLTEAKSNAQQLKLLEQWLRSYKFDELFTRDHGFASLTHEILPDDPSRRLGASKHALGGDAVYKPLKLPDVEEFAEDATTPGTIGSSSMRRAGLYLKETFRLNADSSNFRLMSPDETYSNKLDAVFEETARAWTWPIREWDKDLSPDGRVLEILSEHNLQGLAQGYVLTGRHAVFASYEAFIQVVSSMMDQYAKFLHQARAVPWRGTIPSLTYILTSSGWRQEHNGFSHQNPGFIDDVLRRQGDFVNVYFPADGNSTLAALEACLLSTSQINVIVAGKTLEARWLTPEMARQELKSGIATWDFASDPNPDIIFAAAGDYLVKEALAALDIVKTELPDVRVRFVNILSLTSCGIGRAGTCLSFDAFERYFGTDQPVICNFHGYPETLKSILFDYTYRPSRFSVHGYVENGSTTTPFDMHVRNHTDRYHLVIEALERLRGTDRITPERAGKLIAKYRHKIKANTAFIKEHGVDMPEIEEWVWRRS